MAPEDMHAALEQQGYKQVRVKNNKQVKELTFFFEKKTRTAVNKVQYTQKGDALIKLYFSEKRLGRKKNHFSQEEVNEKFSHMKEMLKLDNTTCSPGRKGGGNCKDDGGTYTHNYNYHVNVNSGRIQITLASRPNPASIVKGNEETAKRLNAAYSCFPKTDIHSVAAIYECIQGSSAKLKIAAPHDIHIQAAHRGIQLNYPTLTCTQLSEFYRKALFYAMRGITVESLARYQTKRRGRL